MVWTDAFQVGVMVLAVVTVTSLGTYQIGGPTEIWDRAEKAKRIQFLKLILNSFKFLLCICFLPSVNLT